MTRQLRSDLRSDLSITLGSPSRCERMIEILEGLSHMKLRGGLIADAVSDLIEALEALRTGPPPDGEDLPSPTLTSLGMVEGDRLGGVTITTFVPGHVRNWLVVYAIQSRSALPGRALAQVAWRVTDWAEGGDDYEVVCHDPWGAARARRLLHDGTVRSPAETVEA